MGCVNMQVTFFTITTFYIYFCLSPTCTNQWELEKSLTDTYIDLISGFAQSCHAPNWSFIFLEIIDWFNLKWKCICSEHFWRLVNKIQKMSCALCMSNHSPNGPVEMRVKTVQRIKICHLSCSFGEISLFFFHSFWMTL